ncbi:ACP phosphodiesterase [Pinirhizobacter soli]|uniref:acyl carrier protein phosphodiesterase n=1 Tax=Pinirhizobacter soli TaxID=2786953 RepID=UPI00202AA5E1|nr:ACP phosphodiesterase [Pinirhizobacter soli]
MNILAHAFLGGADDDLRLGGMMGDFVRGAPDPSLPEGVRRGIVLHRAIDTFTDRHPAVVQARGLFQAPFRRYAGILLDMWFDHCLARDFAAWSDIPLEEYSDGVRQLLRQRRALVPERMHGFIQYMEREGLPATYADRGTLGRAFIGMSHRLSRENPLAEAMPVLLALEEELWRCFRAFFPELLAFAKGHW